MRLESGYVGRSRRQTVVVLARHFWGSGGGISKNSARWVQNSYCLRSPIFHSLCLFSLCRACQVCELAEWALLHCHTYSTSSSPRSVGCLPLLCTLTVALSPLHSHHLYRHLSHTSPYRSPRGVHEPCLSPLQQGKLTGGFFRCRSRSTSSLFCYVVARLALPPSFSTAKLLKPGHLGSLQTLLFVSQRLE